MACESTSPNSPLSKSLRGFFWGCLGGWCGVFFGFFFLSFCGGGFWVVEMIARGKIC